MNFESRLGVAAYDHASAYLLASLLLTVALTGCATGSRIVVNDPAVFQPSIHVGVSLDEEGKQPPSEIQTGKAIEFEHVRLDGGSNQSLASGQSAVNIGNTRFFAPQQLKNDFNFYYSDISFRWRKFFKDRSLGLELAGGVGRASLDLMVASPMQQDSDHLISYGPQVGVAFIWRARPSTSVHLRGSGYFSPFAGVDTVSRYELYVAQALGDSVALRAGYAKWEIWGTTSGAYQSGFNINFSGPTLNLGLDF